MRAFRILSLVTLLVVSSVPADAGSRLPAGPVVNGDFERHAPGGAETCAAAGNQEVNLVVAIVDTCSPGAMKALQWSSPDATTFGDFVDSTGSPGDREVRIPNGSGSNHNLWQAWPNPQQAYSLDFESFEFTLESGAIPKGANIQLGFSLSPGYEKHPFVGIFWEGALSFKPTAGDVRPDGRVVLTPLANGTIICPGGYEPCDGFRENYSTADGSGKRRLLGETRLVQLSFWNFNAGLEPVIIDDVDIVGASTFVEAQGRENPSYPRRGIVGPDPLVNGDFSLAVVGTAVAPGWYGQGTANADPNIRFDDLGGDIKLRTLGRAGTAFGGPTFLGLSNERVVYSGLFEKVTFELTDTAGTPMDSAPLAVYVFLYHFLHQGNETEEQSVSYCIRWSPTSAEAAAGLTLANRDGLSDCFGTSFTEFPFTEEDLANEFELGSFKVFQGSEETYVDDFAMHGAVLFGTYMG